MRRCALLLVVILTACARREAHPPIILISIDTLRADHVSAQKTPHIESLANDATVYTSAWSHAPLTLPSHLSIFTGELPPQHGVRDNLGYRFDAAKHPTIASVLKASGYRTGAAVSAYVLRASTGASSGFDDYDDAIGIVDGAPTGALQRSGDVTEAIAEKWIGGHEREPFFYFLHLYEPHTPYTPTYDADVAHADVIVGKFLAFLRTHGIYDRATIVLLSDHGEGLMDHGEQEHGVLLYREALQVPLIVKAPHAHEHKVVDTPIGLSAVKRITLDFAGAASQPASAPAPGIYSESLYAKIHLGCSALRSLVANDRHVIDGPHAEVYELKDRGERANVIAGERRTYVNARKTIDAMGGTSTLPDPQETEDMAKLASLGYVSAGATADETRDPQLCLSDLAKLKEIAQLQQDGKRQDAIAKMEALVAANPGWSDVRGQLGAAYDEAGDHLRAAKVYVEGARTTPRLVNQFALSAATSLFEAHHLDEAEAHARAIANAEPAAAHLLLGEIALVRNDLDAASREEAIVETYPGSRAHALFLAARIAAAQRNYDRALTLLQSADAARAKNGESLPRGFHYALGDALAHLGRTSDAERELAAEVRDDPHDVQAYADLALLQLMRRDRASAIATIDRMTAANPTSDAMKFAADSLDRWGEHEVAARFRGRVR